MKAPFRWDFYSDQPAILRDRSFKRTLRWRAWGSLLKTFFLALVVLPLGWIASHFIRPSRINGDHFFGIGVNLDKEPHATLQWLQELQVRDVLVRIPLWEMERLGEYVAFIRSLQGYRVRVIILQDREHVEDLCRTRAAMEQIFESLAKEVHSYVIGSTINRLKWGFASVDEYLDFFEVAYTLKRERFTHLELIGSNVIDFEYHYSAHSLFHTRPIRYDALGSLLYVDRRGAPENTQMGFDLRGKIALLYALISLSPKSARALIITETNWPISNTAPYAPTSEHECVSEELYEHYMLRYYLLAFATQKVQCVYWHQLVASGYGLIDTRGEHPRKRSAFEAYAQMVHHLQYARFERLHAHAGEYTMVVMTPRGHLEITWDHERLPIYTYKDIQ